MDTETPKTNHLQISFSLTDQDKRYAGKRLCRYREPALRRKYWLGSAAFLLAWGVLFGLACWLLNNIRDTFIQNCFLFADSPAISLDYCLYKAGKDGSSLWIIGGIIYGITILMYCEQRWAYRFSARSTVHSLNGRRVSLTLSAEGLTHEEAGRSLHFHHWAGVERIIEDQAFLLFYVDRNAAYFVPLAAFAEAGLDVHTFYTQAQQFKAAAEHADSELT